MRPNALGRTMSISVVCPACQSKMRAPDAALGRTGRCPRCGHNVTVIVRKWFYRELGQDQGPFSPAEFLELARRQRVGPETLVRKGAEGRWVPVCKIRGLFFGVGDVPARLAPPLATPLPLADTDHDLQALAAMFGDED